MWYFNFYRHIIEIKLHNLQICFIVLEFLFDCSPLNLLNIMFLEKKYYL